MSDVDLLVVGLCSRGHNIRHGRDVIVSGGRTRCRRCVVDANDEARSLRFTCPSADIDEVVIERALVGIKVRMTEQEFQFAINLLVEDGRSVGEIARLLHAGQRTIASRMLA